MKPVQWNTQNKFPDRSVMMKARARLEIDVAAFSGNLAGIIRQVSPCRVAAVLKANAYGSGVKTLVRAAAEAGVSRIAVAEVNEALQIADAGLPVQILGTLFPDEAAEAVHHGFIVPVTGLESAKMLSREAVKQKKPVICQIKTDTGMGRFGMDADTAFDEICRIAALPGLDIRGIYSHFSSADTPDNSYTRRQLERFKRLLCRLDDAGIRFEDIHTAASNGIAFYPESYRKPFTMVRSGVVMYGCEKKHLSALPWLKPVLSYKSRLVSVREMASGSFVGYGHLHCNRTASRIGTVCAGYADGVPLALTNRGYVIVRGVLCPVVGRVSMDCMNILLDNVPDAEQGDEVICIGSSGEYEITVGDWAALKGTHAHDILCSVGHRVERCYI